MIENLSDRLNTYMLYIDLRLSRAVKIGNAPV